MKEQITDLIEDYQQLVESCTSVAQPYLNKTITAGTNEDVVLTKLRTETTCYKLFVADLKKLHTQASTLQSENERLRKALENLLNANPRGVDKTITDEAKQLLAQTPGQVGEVKSE